MTPILPPIPIPERVGLGEGEGVAHPPIVGVIIVQHFERHVSCNTPVDEVADDHEGLVEVPERVAGRPLPQVDDDPVTVLPPSSIDEPGEDVELEVLGVVDAETPAPLLGLGLELLGEGEELLDVHEFWSEP